MKERESTDTVFDMIDQDLEEMEEKLMPDDLCQNKKLRDLVGKLEPCDGVDREELEDILDDLDGIVFVAESRQ